MLRQLVGVAEVGSRLDPMMAIPGPTTQRIEKAVQLIDWMRLTAAAMYADIGASFLIEYDRMTLDGTEIEERYAPEEARRIVQQLKLARGRYPDLVLAFARPPFQLEDDWIVVADQATLRGEVLADLRTVLDARGAAANAGRRGSTGDAIQSFTSVAVSGREDQLGARIAAWNHLAR